MAIPYILCVTIGPAFLSAAIYLCLARVVVVVGEHVSRLRPQTYTVTFMICDLVALLLQAAGGALASSSHLDTANMGIRVMMAGLSAHVISLALFITLCSDLAWRVRTHRHELDAQFSALRSTRLFRFGLIALGVATLAIFIRTCFRVAELSGGFSGPLIQDEVLYMILEGAMIVIASTLLTIGHPGIAFQGSWDSADFKVGRSKQNVKGGREPRNRCGWRVGSQEIPLASV
ncbi:hypothetical protein V502_01398 [Pseudogymnoascus sp. VKM F-4520 (FW-2644)]|nr:hypothetical protein V502_01398 [Pseudogymnoascus sp. VKM F-4520 (FW-2644)]